MDQLRLLLARRLDFVIALGVFVMVVVGGLIPSDNSSLERPLDPAGVALLFVASMALAFRTRMPIAVTCVTALSALIYYGVPYPGGIVAAVPTLLALYTLSVAGLRRTTIGFGLAFCVAMLLVSKIGVSLGLISVPDQLNVTPSLILAGWTAAFCIAGEMTRHRRAALRAIQERARAAERSRDEALQLVLNEERVRIARELHDSLTHAISIINAQASVGLHLASKQPERTGESLAAIKDSSKAAMNELRSALQVLHTGGDDRPDSTTATLTRLGELLKWAEQAGLRVHSEVVGEPTRLPREVDRAAYRILQESLTNLATQAELIDIHVRIHYTPDELLIEVDNQGGRPPARPNSGPESLWSHGIRERASSVGGTASTETTPSGGLRLRARLPVDSTQALPANEFVDRPGNNQA